MLGTVNTHRLPSIIRAAVPSIITAIRLVLLIPVWILLRHGHQDVTAAILLAVMGITDFLDGYVARRTGAVTTFGKIFDPLSDRVVLVRGRNRVPSPPAIITACMTTSHSTVVAATVLLG